MTRRQYTPWKCDARLALLLIIVAPAAIGAAAYMFEKHYVVLGCAALLCVLAGLALKARARARQHGQQFESDHSQRAVHHLVRRGMTVEVGRMTRVGDIDLIVAYRGRRATVEIKSYRYWRGRLRDRTRQRAARVQARRQKQVAGAAVAIIWLPQAWPNWLTHLLNFLLPETDPVVVMGPAPRLAACLEKLLREGT